MDSGAVALNGRSSPSNIVERSYQLARSGTCAALEDIRRQLETPRGRQDWRHSPELSKIGWFCPSVSARRWGLCGGTGRCGMKGLRRTGLRPGLRLRVRSSGRADAAVPPAASVQSFAGVGAHGAGRVLKLASGFSNREPWRLRTRYSFSGAPRPSRSSAASTGRSLGRRASWITVECEGRALYAGARPSRRIGRSGSPPPSATLRGEPGVAAQIQDTWHSLCAPPDSVAFLAD